ncbi:MAG: c-type cytochrome [Lysobacterales bacterium]
MSRRIPRWLPAAAVLAPLLMLLLSLALYGLVQQGGLAPFRVPESQTRVVPTDPALVERGAYLARIGNCAGCHTASGGEAYAGGRAFSSDYGTVYSSNLTPDPQFGIGEWSLAEFEHAMRHGVSRNGIASPVFPYANFAQLPGQDIEALFAYLGQLSPVPRAQPEAVMAFPANLPGALLAWRLLYHRPVELQPVDGMDEGWQRGRALVNGIGHCAMCHGRRGRFASLAADAELGGSRISGWYAPPLHEGSLEGRFAPGTIAIYLRGGTAHDRAGYGAMADVIAASTRYLSEADAQGIETYLRSLPALPPAEASRHRLRATGEHLREGRALYAQHCADCHGEDGRGEPGRYPALEDSAAVVGSDPVNLVKLISLGAIAPSTPLNPRPHSMPPLAHRLNAREIAALVNDVRERWGSSPRPVTPDEVRELGGMVRH